MAKKKEDKLSYLQMPLPSGKKSFRIAKRSWAGLNYRQTIDSGDLSMEHNISTLESPYLTPSQCTDIALAGYERPISMFGFDDFLLIIYRVDDAIKVDYVNPSVGSAKVYTGVLQESGAKERDEFPRCVVQFNVYDAPLDPLQGKYVKKLLIYPDCKSMDFNITKTGFKIDDMNVEVVEYTNDEEPYLPPSDADKEKFYRNTYNEMVYAWAIAEDEDEEGAWVESVPPGVPKLKYATVHLSRLFGVDDNRVYASGFNDYTNWTFDDVDDYNESGAWFSTAQSNTKADGNFTGITNFQGHVVCFKRDYMHEIYNTKNPFRIQDVYAEGAIDNRTIQDVDGKLIFVSEDNVKIYTGSNPRVISYQLNMPEYAKACSGTDGRCYYLYCEDKKGNKRFFVYDTLSENWSEQDITEEILSFAHIKSGMYMLCKNGYVHKLDSGDYNHEWSFETDLITNETVNIKHIKKMQMFADVNEGAYLKVYALYDDERFGDLSETEKAERLLYFSGVTEKGVDKPKKTGRLAIRVKPRKTANYGIKLHIEGYGFVRLYELELFIENGGGLYV